MSDFSKNKIKWIRSLRLKKIRESLGFYIVEGEKLVNEAIQEIPSDIDTLVYTNDFVAPNLDCNHYLVTNKELEQVSELTTPNKVLAIVKLPKVKAVEVRDELILVLDNIQDPGNMGTILRIADWYGIKSIVCSNNTVDVFNSKVVQATMGAIFRINVVYEDLNTFLNTYKSPIYGALLEGENVYKTTLSKPSALIMGNEGKGISEDVKKLITHPISIPRFGQAESLNVSIATGILVSEFFRMK